MRKFFITGCPRSGTHYLQMVLVEAGLKCTHETVLSPEGVNLELYPECQADVSWCAPRSFHMLHPDDIVWHVTRNPFHVARSLRNMEVLDARQGVHFKCIDRVLGKRFLESSIPEFDFWILWNTIIERRAEHRFRVEDVNLNLVKMIGQRLGWTTDQLHALSKALDQGLGVSQRHAVGDQL